MKVTEYREPAPFAGMGYVDCKNKHKKYAKNVWHVTYEEYCSFSMVCDRKPTLYDVRDCDRTSFILL